MLKVFVLSMLVAAGVLAEAATASAQGIYLQQGYTRQNGTYVAPHLKTYPDGNPYNNLRR